jgi:hypothetical protein
VCFIVDAFSRRIVGWRVAANMKTDMVLDALEMARRSRGARRLIGLVAHAPGLSAPRCASPNSSPRSAPALRSGASRTPTTMRWPRPPTGSTRPSPSMSTPPVFRRGVSPESSSWSLAFLVGGGSLCWPAAAGALGGAVAAAGHGDVVGGVDEPGWTRRRRGWGTANTSLRVPSNTTFRTRVGAASARGTAIG